MMTIEAGMNNVTGVYLFPGIDTTPELCYGLQPSSMVTDFDPFLLVADRDDPENGKAYYFQTTYDKVVVLPGDALQGGVASGKVKRGYDGGYGEWDVQKDVAKIGDKPWFCYWNGTSVEGFIYADKPLFSSTPSPTSATTTPTSGANYSAAAAQYTGSGSKPGYGPPFATPAPSQTITTTFEMPTTTCTYEGEASKLPKWLHDNYPEYTPPPYLRYTEPADDDDFDDKKRKRGDVNYSYTAGQSVPVFPYLVKVEERRREGSPQPYCQQYQLLNDGTWNWIPDPTDDSKPITIELAEHAPSYSSYSASQQRRRGVKRTPDGACHCQWMSG